MRSLLYLALLCTVGYCSAQSMNEASSPSTPSDSSSIESDDNGSPQATTGQTSAPSQSAGQNQNQPAIPRSKQQPKRILGVMPNYRAVSAGAIPPPPTAKEAFNLATENSFDYSAFIFVGITSALAEWNDAHPQLGEGFRGYGNYLWRGFLDKTDGNYMVIFALPTLLHEDERYYALGEGGIWKRGIYAASRVLITPNYQGHNTFNAAEIFGRGISQGVSAFYSPSADRTLGALAVKFGYAVGRDALTNVFREFWPDISSHVLHRHRP